MTPNPFGYWTIEDCPYVAPTREKRMWVDGANDRLAAVRPLFDAAVARAEKAEADADRLAERLRRDPMRWIKADRDALAAHDAAAAERWETVA